MDPYLSKLLCANLYLWIQTIWDISDGSLLEENSICGSLLVDSKNMGYI